MEDGSPRLVGFFGIEGEVNRPVVEVVGVDEGLVDSEAVFGNVSVAGVAGFGIEADLVAGGVVGVELLEEALIKKLLEIGFGDGNEALLRM